MKIKTKATKTPKRNLLVGSWFNADENETGVEFTVTCPGGTYAVRVVDRFDSEIADISETRWDGRILSFAAHWNSTGRFARYRLLALSENRIDVTYTYTDSERYHRKPSKQRKR